MNDVVPTKFPTNIPNVGILRKFQENSVPSWARESIGKDLSRLTSLRENIKVNVQTDFSSTLLLIFDSRFRNIYSLPNRYTGPIKFKSIDVECNSEFVTGKLVDFNLLDKLLQIQLINGRPLDVNFSNIRNAESILNENLNKVLHVHGQVTYNEFDELVEISNVDQLLAVDVSPITVNELIVENNCYTINPPLEYEVQFDYDEYFYTLEGDLDILTFGYSRMEIKEDLDYLLKKFCTDYIQGKAENLAADALIVRKKMLRRFELN